MCKALEIYFRCFRVYIKKINRKMLFHLNSRVFFARWGFIHKSMRKSCQPLGIKETHLVCFPLCAACISSIWFSPKYHCFAEVQLKIWKATKNIVLPSEVVFLTTYALSNFTTFSQTQIVATVPFKRFECMRG
jgi:hypothetical protein